jgi:plastocyanin
MIRTAARLLAATVLLVPLLLATVAVAPAMAGGGCHGIDGTVHTEGPSTVVRMDVCSYAPTVVHVPVGTEVRFLNTAQVDHLVVGESQTWGTESELAPGEEYSRTFADKGVFPYSCPLHPGMVAAVVVGGGGADGAVAPPVAAAPAAGGDAGAQAGSGVASAPAPAAQAGITPAAVALIVTLLAVAAVAGALVWRSRAGRPAASHEA